MEKSQTQMYLYLSKMFIGSIKYACLIDPSKMEQILSIVSPKKVFSEEEKETIRQEFVNDIFRDGFHSAYYSCDNYIPEESTNGKYSHDNDMLREKTSSHIIFPMITEPENPKIENDDVEESTYIQEVKTDDELQPQMQQDKTVVVLEEKQEEITTSSSSSSNVASDTKLQFRDKNILFNCSHCKKVMNFKFEILHNKTRMNFLKYLCRDCRTIEDIKRDTPPYNIGTIDIKKNNEIVKGIIIDGVSHVYGSPISGEDLTSIRHIPQYHVFHPCVECNSFVINNTLFLFEFMKNYVLGQYKCKECIRR